MDLLDQFVGLLDQRKIYQDQFRQFKDNQNVIQEIQSKASDSAKKLDFLCYQRDEISSLELQPGEEAQIENDLKVLKSSSKIIEFANFVEAVFYNDQDSVISRIQSIIKKAKDFENLDT